MHRILTISFQGTKTLSLDMEAFNESYNPKKTFMYRSMSRRQAYTNYLGKQLQIGVVLLCIMKN